MRHILDHLDAMLFCYWENAVHVCRMPQIMHYYYCFSAGCDPAFKIIRIQAHRVRLDICKDH